MAESILLVWRRRIGLLKWTHHQAPAADAWQAKTTKGVPWWQVSRFPQEVLFPQCSRRAPCHEKKQLSDEPAQLGALPSGKLVVQG